MLRNAHLLYLCFFLVCTSCPMDYKRLYAVVLTVKKEEAKYLPFIAEYNNRRGALSSSWLHGTTIDAIFKKTDEKFYSLWLQLLHDYEQMDTIKQATFYCKFGSDYVPYAAYRFEKFVSYPIPL